MLVSSTPNYAASAFDQGKTYGDSKATAIDPAALAGLLPIGLDLASVATRARP
ncbi:hypothetical protein [Rhodococcus sp. BH5]|uniref:hypothetical protein n=1 Tax=Rhodococcus sp. BH5 TaxID=2871702 RepID=UPI0022CD66E6|nr:hypothetical protein [Rhodococcus sp. BH5]MCZ9635359.1 hypothetical protein [Rhodococcus sp. BH5]